MKNKTAVIAVMIVAAASFVFVAPQTSRASLLFSGFGGKVEIPPIPSPGCTALLAPINAALVAAAVTTGILIQINVMQLSILPAGEKDVQNLGIVTTDIEGVPVYIFPPPIFIYQYGNFQTPGIEVLGNAVNLCGVCSAANSIPGISNLCSAIPYVDSICKLATKSTSCPLDNVIFRIGTGAIPDTGKN